MGGAGELAGQLLLTERLSESSPPDWKSIVRHHLSVNSDKVDEICVAREAWMLQRHHGTFAAAAGQKHWKAQTGARGNASDSGEHRAHPAALLSVRPCCHLAWFIVQLSVMAGVSTAV